MASDDGPPLLRPVPRRPFNLNFTGPTPPEDTPSPQPPSASADRRPGFLNLESLNTRLLNHPRGGASRFDDSPNSATGSATISRAQSVRNLTSSTLFGIYSPATTGRFGGDNDEPGTPWGTGAESPAKHITVEDPNYAIQKERSRFPRRRSSLHAPPVLTPPLSKTAVAFHLSLRGLLLFGLGILYGALVARFQDGNKFSPPPMEDMMQPLTTYPLRYMMFWGVSGVVLGGLLPWFDGVWAGLSGQDSALEDDDAPEGGDNEDEAVTDWTLVMRGVGTFIGIVYAIRKLPWASTLQVSLTLALVNPFLWYLIDRSKPGFLLSAAVGLAGSLTLMGLQADMVPTPASMQSSSSFSSTQSGNASRDAHEGRPLQQTMMLGGLASQETLETCIWMLSVLFCSCVCFGNIGRRMALSRRGATKAPTL